MKFTVMNSSLTGRIEMVSKVINSKNVLPILGDIFFCIKDNILHLKASDSENTLMTQTELAHTDGEVTFAVSAKDILEAVKNLPSEAELTFEVDAEDPRVLKATYPNGRFSLPVECADEFPQLPTLKEAERLTFQIVDSVLSGVLARTIFATAQDELRPVMNGVYFDLGEEFLAVVASDGHKLIRSKILTVAAEKGENGCARTGGFILPKKPAGILKNILGRSGQEVSVGFDDRNLEFTCEGFKLCSRLIEGRYPNYNSVIPKNNSNIVTVNRQDLLAALRRISPFSNNASNLVCLGVSENSIRLDAEDYDFSKTASETVTCEYSGKDMKIGFKGSSIIELLGSLTCNSVTMELADPSRAGLFLPTEQPEDEDILMLLMPMLLND